MTKNSPAVNQPFPGNLLGGDNGEGVPIYREYRMIFEACEIVILSSCFNTGQGGGCDDVPQHLFRFSI